MAVTRRRRLLAAAAAAALPSAPPARAQGAPRWEPARPVNLLVGFAPGGCTDTISRLLQPLLQADLGQHVTSENRPGASGTPAALAGTRAPPDGHTLFMTTVSASAVVPPLMHPPPFDILRDQTAVVLAATVRLHPGRRHRRGGGGVAPAGRRALRGADPLGRRPRRVAGPAPPLRLSFP